MNNDCNYETNTLNVSDSQTESISHSATNQQQINYENKKNLETLNQVKKNINDFINTNIKDPLINNNSSLKTTDIVNVENPELESFSKTANNQQIVNEENVTNLNQEINNRINGDSETLRQGKIYIDNVVKGLLPNFRTELIGINLKIGTTATIFDLKAPLSTFDELEIKIYPVENPSYNKFYYYVSTNTLINCKGRVTGVIGVNANKTVSCIEIIPIIDPETTEITKVSLQLINAIDYPNRLLELTRNYYNFVE